MILQKQDKPLYLPGAMSYDPNQQYIFENRLKFIRKRVISILDKNFDNPAIIEFDI